MSNSPIALKLLLCVKKNDVISDTTLSTRGNIKVFLVIPIVAHRYIVNIRIYLACTTKSKNSFHRKVVWVAFLYVNDFSIF